MYKFTYYLTDSAQLRQIAEFVLNYEDAIAFQFPQGEWKRYKQEDFDKYFVHTDSHAVTLKIGDYLRLRITHV